MQTVLLVGEEVAQLVHLALQDRDLPRGFDEQSVVFIDVLLEEEVRRVNQFLYLSGGLRRGGRERVDSRDGGVGG